MTDLRSQRKSQIILSAIEVFGEHGFHKGRVEDIAINADIGKGTIYEYFNSKEEIFQEMLQYMSRTYIEAVKQSTDGQNTAKDKLIAIFDFKREFIIEYESTMEEKFVRFGNISNAIKPFIIDTHKRMFEFIFDIVVEGVKSGEINEDIDPEEVTIFLLSTMNVGTINRIVFKNKKMDSQSIINMIFEGIAVPGTTRILSKKQKTGL